MKTLCSIFLIVLPLLTMAQRIDLLNDKGQIKQSIYPGTVFYQLHGNKKVYINEFVNLKGDTLVLADNYFLKEEIAFIDNKSLNSNCAFVCCTPINYVLIPFQFGLTAIMYQVGSNGNADFGDEIIPVAAGSYIMALLLRKTVNKLKYLTILSTKHNCKNCSYQFVEKANKPNLNLYQD